MKMRRVIAFFLAAVLFAYPILQPAALYALESQLDGVAQFGSTDQDTTQGNAPSADSPQGTEPPGDGDEPSQNGNSSTTSAGDSSAPDDTDGSTLPSSTNVQQDPGIEGDPASSSQDESAENELPVLTYQAYVQDIGWQDEVANAETAGTTGRNKGVEAIRVFIADGAEDAVQIQAHVQDIGWPSDDSWVGNGEIAGTTGQGKRIEAIRMKLSDDLAQNYSIWYRVHVAEIGWMAWTCDGADAGTVGYGHAVEAIQIAVLPKGEVPSDTSNQATDQAFKDRADDPASIEYAAHVREIGWQASVENGATAGTTGHSLPIEAIRTSLSWFGHSGSIQVRAHVEDYGWQGWTTGQAGTTGQHKQLEAVQIKLTDDASQQYDIWYRVHSAEVGWLGWTCNGSTAGTTGLGYGIQAIEIRLLPKGSDELVDNGGSYIGAAETVQGTAVYLAGAKARSTQGEMTTIGDADGNALLHSISVVVNNKLVEGSIQYQAKTGEADWPSEWTSEGAQTSQSSDGLPLKAVKVQLTGELAEQYDVWYRVYEENRGWLGWAHNGDPAGAEGASVTLRAVQVALVKKGAAAPGDTEDAYLTLQDSVPRLVVQAHSAEVSWLAPVSDGGTAGTTSRGYSLQALRVHLDGPISGTVQVRAHVAEIGWQEYVSGDQIAGTTDRSLAIQALQLKLTGDISNEYDVYYRVHSAEYGWLGWAKNGETAGTTGLSLQAEAVQVKLVRKGSEDAPSSTVPAYIQMPSLSVSTHVAELGWRGPVGSNAVAGTTGQSLQMEAFTISMTSAEGSSAIDGGISYAAHVRDIGWQPDVSNGAVAGTTSQRKRIEAIKIRLTGELNTYFDVYYRVHVDELGWLGWAKNGDAAGTTSCSLAVQAMQVVIVRKGAAAPGSTAGAYYSSLASLPYVGYQTPGSYYKVSNKSVSIKNLGVNQFGYRTESRIPFNATREQCINAMVSRAIEYTGTPYRWDYSCAPGVGVDCAGLVMQALYATGMDLTPMNPWDHYYTPGHDHYANDMRSNSRFMHVDISQRQRGDLILYSGHVAIYLGNNTIIEAVSPRVRTVGTIQPFSNKPVLAVVRPFP